jgi:hypothetical protein
MKTTPSAVSRLLSFATAGWLLASPAAAQTPAAAPAASPATPAARKAWPLTRPESSKYVETSRYDDVVSYMQAMAKAAPQIHLKNYGYTFEGRSLPLAVIGAPDATAASVLKTGKTRIFIQGNIHAGEVEGKEAMLWMLRSIAKGERTSGSASPTEARNSAPKAAWARVPTRRDST